MKLKNYWKRFWTLDRHTSAGFTLVELIVVIAILAILAGVGIPVYSGYITKANKQADMTLVSDIEYALTVAGYAGTFEDGESGYITLSTTGISGVTAGSGVDKALKAAFGDNYATTLKLKYDSWGNDGLMNGLSPEMAKAVSESSYMKGGRVDDLLPDVEKMTGMASNLVTALSSGSNFTAGTQLSDLFTVGDVCAIDTAAAKYGIVKDANETWEEWAAKNNGANQTAYSNLLVLTAAEEAELLLNEGEVSGGTQMILEFSNYYAFAANNPTFSSTLDTYLNDLQNVENADEGLAWYISLGEAANAAGYGDYAADQEAVLYDNVAFLTILAGLGNPTEDQAALVAGDLSNANLFTEGVVNGMYNDYLDVVDAMSGMYSGDIDFDSAAISVAPGQVMVIVTQKANQVIVKDSLPR